MKHAILDLDGTLLPGILGAQYLNDLVADGVGDRASGLACVEIIERHVARELPREQMMARAYEHYAATLRGVTCEQARRTAATTWQKCRRTMFPFVNDLLSLFKSQGFHTSLISGNGDLPIQAAVADLGLDWGRGATTRIVDGRFTGELTCVPGLPGGKDAVLRELAAIGEFDRTRSVAIGNSTTDAEIFAHVDLAIAFEPDPELRALAGRNGWHVVDRHTVLDTCVRLLQP